jgi:RNA-dependent RNA polymerase
VFDFQCIKIAGLRSQTVDYEKNGNPANIYDDIPEPLIKFKPDWHKAEVTCVRELDYYVSDRALGYLFRGIELLDLKQPSEGLPTECPGIAAPLEDALTQAIGPLVRSTLNLTYNDATAIEQSSADDIQVEQLHAHYVREMRYICVTHSLADSPDVCLTEEEVVLGTILANCAQPRWRTDRSCRMNLHAERLVDDIYTQIVQGEEVPRTGTDEQLRTSLVHAWAAWCWTQHHREREYVESFALLVLRIVFDCLKRLGGLPEI